MPSVALVTVNGTPVNVAASVRGDEVVTAPIIVGPAGPMGPMGTTIAVPFDEWPPADPVAGTLYLRLAP